jgi:hypothetical protein
VIEKSSREFVNGDSEPVLSVLGKKPCGEGGIWLWSNASWGSLGKLWGDRKPPSVSEYGLEEDEVLRLGE